MRNAINLGSALKDRAHVLECRRDEDGNYAWVKTNARYAHVSIDERNNLFSKVGIGARGATVMLRPCPGLTLHNALEWKGQHLFLTSILSNDPTRLEIKAAVVTPVTMTAKPQDRTGRDNLNRPVAVKVAEFTFPGVLAEVYRREAGDELVDVEVTRRVLVTPKEVRLTRGDLVQPPEGDPYTVVQVLDLDEWKQEYLIERQEDI